jgi:hypothetical protein
MFWNKEDDPKPLGISLGDLKTLLKPTTIKAKIQGNALIAHHEHYKIRLEVVPPENRESENGPIKAVVRIFSGLPSPILALFKENHSETIPAFNSFAALGALTHDKGELFIGSRLTIYEKEDAWQTLHLPLLFYILICGSEAILGGLRHTFKEEAPLGSESQWKDNQFEAVKQHLSRFCVCSTGGGGLTAEFSLSMGATSAIAGDHKTALFQMTTKDPHPELGGGLFTVLQMPHLINDQKRLEQICMQLNKMEMAAHDLPPHFGAWCPGKLGNNVAYVSFYPNELHMLTGVEINVAYWAINRSQWANAILVSLGCST